MNLHLNLDDEYWTIVLTFHNSPIEHIAFSEPNLFDIETLSSMIKKSTSRKGLSGGGNSSWSLDKINDEYYIEYDISGAGEDSSIKVKLPRNEMHTYLNNLFKLRACDDINDLHQFALTLDGVNVIV